MILKFRAWIKTEKCFADYIESIRFYINEIDLCWGGICESDCFDFNDVILMQSTGLKDKDGKEIFEGDVVKCNGLLGTIESFKAMWICSFVKYNNYQKVGFFAQEIEVVGNIYENPELLEGK
jgi:uncharacterized phage protein (TIGR01671 family)